MIQVLLFSYCLMFGYFALYHIMQIMKWMENLQSPSLVVSQVQISTETNLSKKILTDPDRKYIVQILATMLMTYVQKPSIQDCLDVSCALLAKHKFLQKLGAAVSFQNKANVKLLFFLAKLEMVYVP